MLVTSTRSIHSHESKHISTSSDANGQVGKPPHVSITKRLCRQQNSQTVIESDLHDSSTDKTTNVTLPVILTQYLHKTNNNHINVIKSITEKTKTTLQELTTDRDEKKE